MTAIELPWPPAVLSPNARPHWAAKAKAFKHYKSGCFFILMAERNLRLETKFKFTFCPPDKRRYDTDNLVGRVKALQDAIAIVTGVDDSKFEITYARGGVRKGGAVIVEVLG